MCLGRKQCEKYICHLKACRNCTEWFLYTHCHGNVQSHSIKILFKSHVLAPRCNIILPSTGELVLVKGSKISCLQIWIYTKYKKISSECVVASKTYIYIYIFFLYIYKIYIYIFILQCAGALPDWSEKCWGFIVGYCVWFDLRRHDWFIIRI